MKRLLIALFIGATATTAHATHLLHKLPADAAETIQRDCKQRWPNSARVSTRRPKSGWRRSRKASFPNSSRPRPTYSASRPIC